VPGPAPAAGKRALHPSLAAINDKFLSFQHERQGKMKQRATAEENNMRKEYDFSKAKKNPYVRQAKTPLSIRHDQETIQAED
jgi:hypothetical protein